MPTTGTVVLDKVTWQVTGISWLDRYPTRCVFRALQIGTELTVEVPYNQQEIVSAVDVLTKFEGTATVTSTYQGQQVTGHAFLELVGNWS